MSDALSKVYLVRHGETAWSISGQHTGHTDIPLTEQGERDAQALRARLKGTSFAKVLTSPLQRARRTGELAGFGESAQPDPDLMEWDYGAYEGRRTLDIRAERAGWRLLKDGCPDGETLAEVSTRADRVMGRIDPCAGEQRAGLRAPGHTTYPHRPLARPACRESPPFLSHDCIPEYSGL